MAERMINPKGQNSNKNTKEDDVLSKKTKATCEDDVLSLVDEEIDNLSTKRKGKKSLSGNAKTTPSTSRTCSSSKNDNKSTGKSDNSDLMNILKSIQDNQRKQDEKLNGLTDKVKELYDYDEGQDELYDDDHDDNNNEGYYEPPAKKSRSDDNNNTTRTVSKDSERSDEVSRFATMRKRFKQKEITGDKIDETLANNITDLFRNGMDDFQYSEIIKDEVNPRPENCDGLVVVKTNQLIWELISPFAQTCDKKMQAIEKSVVKSAVLLSNTVNRLAKAEKDKNTDDYSNVIDGCNDVLALLGHTNRQINLARRDFIRPELNNEYTYLCAHSQPYTTFLFGDDVSKAAKDIEDCSKIANRIHFGRGGSRGGYKGRFIRGRARGRRGRGNRGRGRGSYDNSAVATTSHDSDPKNYPRRGGREDSEKCKQSK